MRINKGRLVSEFIKLVSIDSPSFGEKQMGEHIKNALISLNFSVFEDNSGKKLRGNCGNIYGFLKGELQGEPLLFSAHMDTVEPSRGKQAIVAENGIITSNGETVLGADDCSGIAAILEALRTIKDQNLPHRSIEVLFTIAEEVYCKGVQQFDGTLLKAKEAYVLDLIGTVGTAAYKAPTILSFTVTIKGKSAHAGFAPETGIHAIAIAANAISQIKMGRIDENTTLNIGTIEGGRATNIVPDLCTVCGEIRSFYHDKALEQLETPKNIFINNAHLVGGFAEFEVSCGSEAYETKLDSPVIKRFERACRKLALPVTLLETFGGSDNNYLSKFGIAGIVVASAMNNCHSCQEYTTADELQKIAELTVSLMTDNMEIEG